MALTAVLAPEAFGDDVRLVAFMQYLRLVCVAVAATIVARLALGPKLRLPAGALLLPMALAAVLQRRAAPGGTATAERNRA